MVFWRINIANTVKTSNKDVLNRIEFNIDDKVL